MANNYPILDTVTLNVVFTTIPGGAPIDPNTVQCFVKDPQNVVTTYTYPATIIRDGEGLYHLEVVPAVSGRWFYKFQGSGGGVATTSPDELFDVTPSVLIDG